MKKILLLLSTFLLIGCQKKEAYNNYACGISSGSNSYLHLELNENNFTLSHRRNDTAEEISSIYGNLSYLSDNIMYLEVDENVEEDIQKEYIPLFLKKDKYGFYYLFDLNATVDENDYGYDGGKLLRDYTWNVNQIVEVGESIGNFSFDGYKCIKLPEAK